MKLSSKQKRKLSNIAKQAHKQSTYRGRYKLCLQLQACMLFYLAFRVAAPDAMNVFWYKLILEKGVPWKPRNPL